MCTIFCCFVRRLVLYKNSRLFSSVLILPLKISWLLIANSEGVHAGGDGHNVCWKGKQAFTSAVQSIPLSNDTNSHRVEQLDNNIKGRIILGILNGFSLAVDKTGDINGVAQLEIYMCYIDGKCIRDEFLNSEYLCWEYNRIGCVWCFGKSISKVKHWHQADEKYCYGWLPFYGRCLF